MAWRNSIGLGAERQRSAVSSAAASKAISESAEFPRAGFRHGPVVVLRKRAHCPALALPQAAERLRRGAIGTGQGKRGPVFGGSLAGVSTLQQNFAEQKVSAKERGFLFGVAALDVGAHLLRGQGKIAIGVSSSSAAS